jgi:hypothetical protein
MFQLFGSYSIKISFQGTDCRWLRVKIDHVTFLASFLSNAIQSLPTVVCAMVHSFLSHGKHGELLATNNLVWYDHVDYVN